MASYNALKEPFPTDILSLLDFGKIDGRLDDHLEESFVITRSTKKFFQDKHSIIIAPMGAGKSALFELVKTKSSVIPVYKDRTIVPIEESVDFKGIKILVDEISQIVDEKNVYRMIWKFHIISEIAGKLSEFVGFPNGEDEKEVNDFLRLINSKQYDESLIGKFFGLLKNASLKIKTKISSTPVSVEAVVEGDLENKKSSINLDRIIEKCINSVEQRNEGDLLVIIDRIDRFVSGEEYDVQRMYIEALLEVDDDFSVSYPRIHRKIFLRDDLFCRLNYESLGYDKVIDNTLRLEWSDNELIKFMSRRIFTALKGEKLLSPGILSLSTDLSQFNLEGIEVIRTIPFIPLWVKKIILNYDNINSERDSSLTSYLDRSIVTKIFPREIKHTDSSGNMQTMSVFDFFLTHFKDGHNKVTPRNLLVYIKCVVDVVTEYYDENPDQTAHVKLINGDYEWTLFKEKCVYKAYLNAKKEYTRAVSKVENEWTRYFSTFLGKRGNKKVFDFNWMKSITNLDDGNVTSFIAYLDHIGYLQINESHPDLKKRTYKLPIIFMPTPKGGMPEKC